MKTKSRSRSIKSSQKTKSIKKKQQLSNPLVIPKSTATTTGLTSSINSVKSAKSVNSIKSVNSVKSVNSIKSDKSSSSKKSKSNKLNKKDSSINQQKQPSHQIHRTKSILEELQKYTCQKTIDKKYKIVMHSSYQIDQSHELYQHIEQLFGMFVVKEKKKAQEMFFKTRYTYYPTFQFLLSGEKPSESKCCICQFQFEDVQTIKQHQEQLQNMDGEDIVALKCSHLLHQNCLKMLLGDKEWFKCPVCSMIYGKMIGDQPPGNMSVRIDNNFHCDGFQDCGTIQINYSMSSGKRGDISFPGTGRTAYLPNNVEGNEVLNLLKEAFDRKLIFTVGRSVTTGRDNQIVWNGIHHKTNMSGGSSHFGYPDPTYFDRVKLELAAKGIF